MEDCRLVLYIQENHKSLKAVFESEPEEEHDDHQVTFQVQSQQCCYKVHVTRDTAKRELVDASPQCSDGQDP